MRAQLQRLAELPALSKDVREVVSRSLGIAATIASKTAEEQETAGAGEEAATQSKL